MVLAMVDYIQSLYFECNWLMQNSDVRKSACANEIEALKSATVVLNSVDCYLLQMVFLAEHQ
eukprot:13469331-Heterocapsa_arctica.AAC.1